MLAAPQFNDPKYWHQRAEQARAMAKQMNSELSKKMMLKVADDCDGLAVSGRKETCSPAVLLRNVRALDEQYSELQKLRNRVRKAEMRLIGRKRRRVARLLTDTSKSRAPIGASLIRRH
jgi:hypothetical protein